MAGAVSEQLLNLQSMSAVGCLCWIFGESTRSLTCKDGGVLKGGRSAKEEREASSMYMYEVLLIGH